MNENILIETKNVSKYYQDGAVAALADVNLKVREREFIVITGPSGSGKSTLLHLIGGLDSSTKGEIYFQNQPIKETIKKGKFRLNNIGFVFQEFYLWSVLNVYENVFLPLMGAPLSKQEKRIRVHDIVERVGLKHKLLSSVNKLSVGERQRVAIARALVLNPKLLLADEPTGNLDSENGKKVLEIFQELNKRDGLTIIMVTHDFGMAKYATRIIKMLDGRIID
jgi:putative ABC transport system ATP-binding protein